MYGSSSYRSGYVGYAMARRSITIYTDGCCLNNGRAGPRGGIGVHFPNGELDDISEPLPGYRQTNQRAEIYAAIRGLLAVKKDYDEVVVKLDSRYVKDAMEEWMPRWVEENWSRQIKNGDLFKRLYEAMKGIEVDFDWIPRELNNRADVLAKRGANW